MKFILLNEDGTESTPVEIHIYHEPGKGYFYYDGTKLKKIPIKIMDKIIRKSEDEKRDTSKESDTKRKERLAKIKKDLTDDKMLADYKWEEESRKYNMDDDGPDKPELSARQTKLMALQNDIEDFIAMQTGVDLRLDYGKDNPFNVDPDIISKSRMHRHMTDKPVINVYFDRSGSWGDYDKTSLGWDAIAALQEYEQADLIDVNVYYFAVHVFSNEADALREINNSGEPIIQHMIQTQPDNVVIMTDTHVIYPDDYGWWPDHQRTCPTSVYHAPGACWGIFYGCSERDAKETMKHIQGNPTKYYLFGYND